MTELLQCNLDKRFDLSSYENFVETGCHTGSGIREAIRLGIKNIYSCDLAEKWAIKCQMEFHDAYIMNSDSITFLKMILETLSGKTIFWLDAHFPNSYGFFFSEEYRFPLVREMNLIKMFKKNYKDDIIIFDDVHVFQDEKNPVRCDVLKAYEQIHDHRFDDIVSLFEPTHEFKLLNVMQGVGFYIPKGEKR